MLLIIVAASYYFLNKYGNKIPELPVLTAVEDQSILNQEELKGKVVIVSYFQTWCSDCVKEQPELQKLSEHFGKDKLRILMVSDEDAGKLATFKKRFGSKLDFYKSEKSLGKELGVKAYPTTVLYDKKSEIKLKKVEGIDWYNDETINLIESLQ